MGLFPDIWPGKNDPFPVINLRSLDASAILGFDESKTIIACAIARLVNDFLELEPHQSILPVLIGITPKNTLALNNFNNNTENYDNENNK